LRSRHRCDPFFEPFCEVRKALAVFDQERADHDFFARLDLFLERPFACITFFAQFTELREFL